MGLKSGGGESSNNGFYVQNGDNVTVKSGISRVGKFRQPFGGNVIVANNTIQSPKADVLAQSSQRTGKFITDFQKSCEIN